jgi:hypothetical protein
MHSRTNYDGYCLSYAFAYRDFTGGVVGLAWVASPALSGTTITIHMSQSSNDAIYLDARCPIILRKQLPCPDS